MSVITLVTKNLERQVRVTEHINTEWLVQASELDIFSWLQTTLRQKERYLYHDEKLIIQLTMQKLSPTLWRDLVIMCRKHLQDPHTK